MRLHLQLAQAGNLVSCKSALNVVELDIEIVHWRPVAAVPLAPQLALVLVQFFDNILARLFEW